MHFYFEKKQYVSLALRNISELKEFPFISKFCVGFKTQLMSLTKTLLTVINVRQSADISIQLCDENNKSLLHRGLVIKC